MLNFKYQNKDSDYIKITDNEYSLELTVNDYSRTFKYNTVNINSNKLYNISPEYYIKDLYPILNENVLITCKQNNINEYLYYQYQPKYDLTKQKNFRLLNSQTGEDIVYTIEYAYYKQNGELKPLKLSRNNEIFYDSLNGYVLNGDIISDTIAYADFNENCNIVYYEGNEYYIEDNENYKPGTIISESINIFTDPELNNPFSGNPVNNVVVRENCPIEKTGKVLSQGTIKYHPTEGYFSLYFKPSVNIEQTTIDFITTDNINVQMVYGSNDKITFKANAFEVDLYKNWWYKLDIHENTIKITAPGNHSISENFEFTILTDEIVINSNDNLHIFDISLTTNQIEYGDYAVIDRYSSEIIWKSVKENESDDCYIRFLFKDKLDIELIYDAVKKNGEIYQNLTETVNYKLIYSGYNIQGISASWSSFISNQMYFIYFKGELLRDIQENNIKDVCVNSIKQNNLSVNVINDKIYINNCYFKSNDYENNKLFYYLPEYSEMSSFACDTQGKILPNYYKVIKEKAYILDQYTFQIQPFYIHEGEYPSYEIPHIYECNGYIKDGVYTETIIGENKNYRDFRGINIYINNTLLDNSEIYKYNMKNGIISLRRIITSDDIITVTYLKNSESFEIQYPIINTMLNSYMYNNNNDEYGIGDYKNIELYLKPYKYNDSRYKNDPNQERLCYKLKPFNNNDENIYRSCLTGEILDYATSIEYCENDIIKIADISIALKVKYKDNREFGGGIKKEYIDDFKYSKSFMDIGFLPNGKLYYRNILIIKIPKSIKDDLQAKYFKYDENKVYKYIKDTIRKYLPTGAFFILVDENYQLWDNWYEFNK